MNLLKISRKLLIGVIFTILFSPIINNAVPESVKKIATHVKDGAANVAERASKITVDDVKNVGFKAIETIGNGVGKVNDLGEKSLKTSRQLEKGIFDFLKYAKEKATPAELATYSVTAIAITYIAYKTVKGIYGVFKSDKK